MVKKRAVNMVRAVPMVVLTQRSELKDSGFEDIFSNFLVVAVHHVTPRQGDDLYRYLTFEEAIFGEKEVKYNEEQAVVCGSGAKPGTSPVTWTLSCSSSVINVDTQTPR